MGRLSLRHEPRAGITAARLRTRGVRRCVYLRWQAAVLPRFRPWRVAERFPAFCIVTHFVCYKSKNYPQCVFLSRSTGFVRRGSKRGGLRHPEGGRRARGAALFFARQCLAKKNTNRRQRGGVALFGTKRKKREAPRGLRRDRVNMKESNYRGARGSKSELKFFGVQRQYRAYIRQGAASACGAVPSTFIRFPL